MVLPPESEAPVDGRLAAEVADATMRGAKRATPNVARATATLGDTAVIVGCDPAERACVDAVAAALNVDQMLMIRITAQGDAAAVEVTAVSREAQPVSRTFMVRPATRKQDLAAIEAAVPGMLDAEGRDPDDATPVGDGDGDGDGNGDGDGDGDGPPPDPIPGPGPGPANGGSGGFAAKAPVIITIGGGVLAAAGLLSWGLAASKQNAIDDAPTATQDDLIALEDLENSGRRYATVGNGLVIAGGLAAAAGGLWWWHSRSRRDDRAPVVTPVVGPDGAGLSVGGRW